MNRQNRMTGILLLLAVATSQAAVVREWNFDTAGDVEGWGQVGENPAYRPVQATGTDGTSGIMRMAGPLGEDADPRHTIMLDKSLNDLGPQFVEWDKVVFRVRQIAPDGATPVPWSNEGTTALVYPGGPKMVVKTFGPGGLATAVSHVEQEGGWLLCSWDISAMQRRTIQYIRIDFIGGPVNTGKNFEVDFVQLHAQQTPGPIGMLVGAVGRD